MVLLDFVDSLCQRRREQKRARVSSGAAADWREVQLHLPQGPWVHSDTLPLPRQLWGVHQTAVEHVQTTTCPRMPALPHQMPQRSHGQERGHHRPMQRWGASFTWRVVWEPAELSAFFHRKQTRKRASLQWTTTYRRPRTCCCWPSHRRSSRNGWADWWRRSRRNLHRLRTSYAPPRAPPWRSSPASPRGGPVDSSPPARAGRQLGDRRSQQSFLLWAETPPAGLVKIIRSKERLESLRADVWSSDVSLAKCTFFFVCLFFFCLI